MKTPKTLADRIHEIDITRIADDAGAILSINLTLLLFGVPIALTGLGDLLAEGEGWWLVFMIFVGAGAAVLWIIRDFGRSYWRAWQLYASIIVVGTLAKLGSLLFAGEIITAVIGGAIAALPLFFLLATFGGSTSLLSARIDAFDCRLVDILAESRRLFSREERGAFSSGRQYAGRALFLLGAAGAFGFPAALLLSSIRDLSGLPIPDDFVTAGSLLIFAFPVAGALILFGRRLMQPRAQTDLAQLGVRPTILLRAFSDDNSEIERKSGLSTILSFGFERLGFDPNIRLEHAIADELWRIGPFYAVGYPGEQLPRLGAAKISLADGQWQGVVQGWIRDCRLIVMIAGRSNWLAWELGQVIGQRAIGKLVILLPPDQPSARQERWSFIAAHFQHTRLRPLIAALDTSRARAVWFKQDGTLRCVCSGKADQESYEIAISLAAYDILKPASPRPEASKIKTAASSPMSTMSTAPWPTRPRSRRQRWERPVTG